MFCGSIANTSIYMYVTLLKMARSFQDFFYSFHCTCALELVLVFIFLTLQKAKGDVKKTGKPDPYAYMPLLRHKLNRRKKAGLTGQFAGIMSKAKKGSALGRKQLKRRR